MAFEPVSYALAAMSLCSMAPSVSRILPGKAWVRVPGTNTEQGPPHQDLSCGWEEDVTSCGASVQGSSQLWDGTGQDPRQGQDPAVFPF